MYDLFALSGVCLLTSVASRREAPAWRVGGVEWRVALLLNEAPVQPYQRGWREIRQTSWQYSVQNTRVASPVSFSGYNLSVTVVTLGIAK